MFGLFFFFFTSTQTCTSGPCPGLCGCKTLKGHQEGKRQIRCISPGMICLKAGKAQPKQPEAPQERGALLPSLTDFPVRITYPVISLLFKNSQAYCPAQLGKNRKGHHKPRSLSPPSPVALEEKSPYCSRNKGEGSSWFRCSAMNGPGLEGLGRFWGACSRRAPQAGLIYSTMGCTQPPRQGYLSQAIQGVDGDSSATAGIFAPHPQREIRGLKLS